MSTVPIKFKQTDVGLIPIDWEAPTLESIARRGSGHTPDKKHPEYWDGDIKWISLKDSDALDRVFIEDTAASITQAGIANSSAVVHPPGTVVLSRDAGVGKSAIMKTSMAVSQHFMAWRCGPSLHNTYLYYWLQSRKPEFERIAMGSTIKTIGLPYFKDLRIPLPPIREQQAMSSALLTIERFISKLDALIAKKRGLKQGAIQQLLTGKTRLPGFDGDWNVKRLGDLGQFLKGRGIRKDEASSGQLACIRYGEIYTQHDDCIRAYYSWISEDVARTAVRLRRGDLLFAGSGETKEEIGKSAAFLDEIEAYAGGDIIILRPYASDPVFMGYYLNTRMMNAQKASRGQGDAVVHISASALSTVEAIVPQPDEQAAIGAALSEIDAEIAALEARRDKTRALKQGMMQELLTGRMRLV